MNIHPSVIILSKRLKLFLPLSGLFALVTYLLTLSSGVFPGVSAVLSAAAGIGVRSGISHPLFALVTRCVASFDIFSLPVRLNLFSVICGVLCAMLIYHLIARMILFCACEDSGGSGLNALSMLPEEDSTIEPEVARYNKRIMKIAIAGGLFASFIFVFSIPVWIAATRLNYGLFDLLLFLASVALFPACWTSFWFIRIMLSVFLFVLGLFESAVFLLMLPIYAFFILKNFVLSCQRLLIAGLVMAAGVAGVVFSLYVFRQNMSEVITENFFNFLISYARSLSVHHYNELRSFFPRSGWLLIIIQMGFPVMVLLFGRQILFKEKRLNTLIALVMIVVVVIPAMLNLPISPFSLFQAGYHLPVFTYTIFAVTLASALSACLVFLGPVDKSQDEDIDYEDDQRVFRQMKMVWILIPVILFLSVIAPLRNFRKVDMRKGMFADAVAREMLGVMKERTWLISNGYLGNHLLIEAKAENKQLNLVVIGSKIAPEHQARIKKQIEFSAVFEGLNRQRLLNAFSVSPVRFVMEWFRMAPDAGKHAMVFATPDIWTECGHQAVPEGLAFGGVSPGTKLDLNHIDRVNQSFAGRVVSLIEEPKGSSVQLVALSSVLRTKSAFSFNELGVMLEDAEQYEAAYQAYERASQIDPMNVSAAMNRYTLALNQKIHPESLDLLKKRTSKVMSNQNISVKGLMGILQNYGTIRQPVFYQQQASMWSSIGSRTITAEKFRKAIALSGQTGASALVLNAKVYIQSGNRKKAKECYLTALEQDDKNKAALSGLSTLLLTRGNTVEAEKWIQKALDAGVEKEELLHQIISLAVLKGETDQALEYLKTATKKYPEDPRYWSQMADVLLDRGDIQVVEQMVLPRMRLSLKNPDHFLVHAVCGFLLRKKGSAHYREARLSLLKAVNINASLPQVWDAIFELDMAIGSLEFAEIDAQNKLNLDPEHAFANYLMGVSLLNKNKLPESEDYLRRSIENKPTSAACNDLAENLRIQKKFIEAEKFARQALEMKPDLLFALDTLASVLADAGKYSDAVETATKALGIKNDYAPAQLTLLRTKVLQGDKAGVLQRLAVLEELNIDIPEALKKEIRAL